MALEGLTSGSNCNSFVKEKTPVAYIYTYYNFTGSLVSMINKARHCGDYYMLECRSYRGILRSSALYVY